METGEIPSLNVQLKKQLEALVAELNLSEELTNMLREKAFNPYLPDYNNYVLRDVEKLDVSDDAKERISEVRKIPPLYDQLVEIVAKSDFPEGLKAHILRGNGTPYGSLERPLQEEVLVSVRKESRKRPLS